MFKGIQVKLVTMFLVLVMAVIVLTGAFLTISISNFYDHQFSSAMNKVFTDDFINQTQQYVATSKTPIVDVENRLFAYAPQLGIDSYCNFFVIDARSGEILASSDITKTNLVSNTSSIIAALNGKRASTATSEYMDFAVPVDQYIVYIYNSKQETKTVMREILKIILQSMAVGVGISLILGFFLSRNITKPISNLTKQAKQVATGNFRKDTERVVSSDEIGELSLTFEYMSDELESTLSTIEYERVKMQAILQNMGEGVIAFDNEGRIIHINPSARDMLSIYRVDTVEFDELFRCVGIDINIGSILYLNNKNIITKKLFFNEKYLSIYFAKIELGKQNKTGVVVGVSDITDSERLDESRREFVANVSHELRTPLTTIKAYTETVLNGGFEDKVISKRFLGVVMDEVDRMTRMVQDLLLLSKLDHGKMSFKMSEVKMHSLIKRVVYKMGMGAKEHSLVLTYVNTNSISNIFGDSDKVEQVLTNILSNAIKYTPDGGTIEVFAGTLYSNTYVKIIDNGIGISKDDQKRIFERFYRVDKARTRAAGGTGLGLAIAEQIVTAHNGKITLNSRPGEGTEVIISFPVLDSNKKQANENYNSL